MVIDDYETIVQWHPEMILISETPVTWQGFLSVSCRSNLGRSSRIKMKLIVPNYPSLSDAEINFGKKVSFVRSREFTRGVKELMRNASKVSLFLRQLQSLISSLLDSTQGEDHMHGITDNTAIGILQELRDAFDTPSEVRLLSDNNLNTIKLSLKNISLKLQRTKYSTCPWTVVSSDLPEIPAFGSFERNVSTLNVARNKFKLQVEMLEKSWSSLRQIDEKCWVIDPLQPKPCHLYRRIYLSLSLSMLVKIDPLNPMDLPEIKFLGSETEVEMRRDIVSNNLHNWDPKTSVIDNLMMLLNIDAFPQKEKQEYVEDKSAIVRDEECCICFTLELENENLPNKICSNEKCRRHFHTSCLLQWLQAIAGNHVVFDHIHGVCPHCGESISCCIK